MDGFGTKRTRAGDKIQVPTSSVVGAASVNQSAGSKSIILADDQKRERYALILYVLFLVVVCSFFFFDF
jgi:hypothetical protein